MTTACMLQLTLNVNNTLHTLYSTLVATLKSNLVLTLEMRNTK